jgi:ATP-dependent Clp protease ATP-binding subunit ClpC
MVNEIFNYHGMRAVQARASALLGGALGRLLVVGGILVLIAGVGLLVLGSALGWFVSSLSVWMFVVHIWYRRYLRKLPVGSGQSMDARLEAELLGHLPAQLTPKTLATALAKSRGGQFMTARFGIGPTFVQNTLSDDPVAVRDIWQCALQLQPQGTISAATMLAAMTQTQESLKQLLPHLQLDEEDVTSGTRWYQHLSELIESHSRPRRTGGIARDWTFGYTPLLSRFGLNVSDQVVRGNLYNNTLEAHAAALDFLIQTFSNGGKQNAALVGPLGVGKTTVVAAFAEKLMSADSGIAGNLKFRQVVSLDASSLISAASGRGELEHLVNELLVEAYRAKNIILCLDDAQLFFEEGVGSVDLSNILLPVLQGGGLRMILTMDEQRWLQIAARNPALAAALNRITVQPANQQETMAVLQDQLIMVEFQRKVTFMYQALKEAYRLSERYLYDQAQPGKALRLLESAAGYADQGVVTAGSVRQAIEQTQGVKVGANTSTEERDKLLNLEQLIHQRMINQVRAVQVVSDALRRARAGVRNESKPIGTFLFLGPTGVGKTELSKALAEVYFGGENHIVRLDMNEFVGPNDVRRLIADGADDPHSLCAQVMKQPFSVVLLDELEKAHDAVLTTLLQVLDEGILRDIKGREVSFRDVIFIATSNAGADHIRHHIEAGEELEQFEQALTDELISSGQFRPEFLNRFDEIVLFRSLKPEELMQVVDLIIAGINKTLAPQKISVSVDDQLKQWLVQTGNDPRLGARPMRRIVQRVVENTMAKRMLSGEVQAGQTVQLTIADVPAELQNTAKQG